VALFVVAEPLKKAGKYTFTDALDNKFNSKAIQLMAAISTLVVSVCYLIPQMVGAGSLVQPLLGFPHWVGVVLVGLTVIVIVVTAGMVSTTWVQFLKGSLLVFFSAILTMMILARGFETRDGGIDGHAFRTLGPFDANIAPDKWPWPADMEGRAIVSLTGEKSKKQFVQVGKSTWSVEPDGAGKVFLHEAQTTKRQNGVEFVNGQPKGNKKGEPELHPIGHVSKLPGGKSSTGRLGLISFFSTLQQSEVVLWRNDTIKDSSGSETTVYYQKPTPGSRILRPGEHPRFKGIRSDKAIDKLNFLSLMLALFCGTASLPHILIRYYTVRDAAAARKSTIVGIASIGFFYILTLYLGLGAMTSGALDLTDTNMAAPLLARSMNEWLFAAISAIAFTTVLGTVSGLILASAGAVTHDLMSSVLNIEMSDYEKVRVAKITSIVVGVIAIALGILFKGFNVSYLVGWAFSIAASANLPALVMVLFWKGVTRQGVIAGIVVGLTSSLAWILLSADTFDKVYGLPPSDALVPFSQPGIVTIPLGFLTLIVVSLMTTKKRSWK
jgi:cation/acetate symporter